MGRDARARSPAANDVVRKINALVASYRAHGDQRPEHRDRRRRRADPDGACRRTRRRTRTSRRLSGDLLFTTNGADAGERALRLRVPRQRAHRRRLRGRRDDPVVRRRALPADDGRSAASSRRRRRSPSSSTRTTRATASHPSAIDGILTPTDGVVTGYDFMTDEATQISARTRTHRLTHRRFELVHQTRPGRVRTITAVLQQRDRTAAGIMSVNAHYNHWELAPRLARSDRTQAASCETARPAGADDRAQLRNAILFTMGCHAGLNVSDAFPADRRNSSSYATGRRRSHRTAPASTSRTPATATATTTRSRSRSS